MDVVTKIEDDNSMGGSHVAPFPTEDGPLPRSLSRRPVDLVHLARYTLGNRSFEREILRLFSTQSALCLKRLKNAVGDTAWQDACRTITGSAVGIGAWRVAGIAEASERLTGAAIAESRDAVIDSLEREIDEVDRFIRALLADA